MTFSDLVPVANLVQFALHFATAIVAVGIFGAAWLKATPFNELALIRQNNAAAAISFGGALIGFAIAEAGVIRASETILIAIAWSLITLLLQMIGLYLVTRIIHNFTNHIKQNDQASAIFQAAIGIAIGLLSAACVGG